MLTGKLCTIKELYCEDPREHTMKYRVVSEPNSNGQIDIEPMEWHAGPIVPIENVGLEMVAIEP